MAFVDLAGIKAVLGIPTADTSQDAILTLAVDAANQTLLNEFNLTTDVSTAYLNEVHDIDHFGERFIRLERYPVISIEEVRTKDGEIIDAGDYDNDDFGLLRLCGATLLFFPLGRCAVEVDYTAGFAPVDGLTKLWAMAEALQVFNTLPKAGYESERIGRYAYKLMDPGGGGAFASATANARAQMVRPFC